MQFVLHPIGMCILDTTRTRPMNIDREVRCAGGLDPEQTSHTYPKCLKIQR